MWSILGVINAHRWRQLNFDYGKAQERPLEGGTGRKCEASRLPQTFGDYGEPKRGRLHTERKKGRQVGRHHRRKLQYSHRNHKKKKTEILPQISDERNAGAFLTGRSMERNNPPITAKSQGNAYRPGKETY